MISIVVFLDTSPVIYLGKQVSADLQCRDHTARLPSVLPIADAIPIDIVFSYAPRIPIDPGR